MRTNGLIAFFGPRSGVADDPRDIDSSASAQDLQHIMAAHIESCYEHSKRMIIRFEQEHGSIQEL